MSECCETCGQPVRLTRKQKADRFIEDVEDLFELGADEYEVVRKMGRSADAIAHRLKRWGRPDLASGFWLIAWRDRNQRRAA